MGSEVEVLWCSTDGCLEPAIAGVCAPIGINERPAYALIRRLTKIERRGQHVCLHHAHVSLDWMLMHLAAQNPPGVSET